MFLFQFNLYIKTLTSNQIVAILQNLCFFVYRWIEAFQEAMILEQ